MFKKTRKQLQNITIATCLSASMALIPQTVFALTPEEATKAINERNDAIGHAESLSLELAYRDVSEEELQEAILQSMKLWKEHNEAHERVEKVKRSMREEK